MKYDLEQIETELKKRLPFSYQWGVKQNDEWDRYTNFIYRFQSWEAVVTAMKATAEGYNLDKRKLFNYAANRWFNFWSAIAIEQIFTEVNGIIPALNSKNRLVDFNIFGINFDHKTSKFPQGFQQTFYYAQRHEEELLYWFYKNQSQQQRKHFGNRLFIIVYAENGEHWKLKAEISWLKQVILKYVATFDASKLKKLEFDNQQSALATIIWAHQ
ncbi:hypothetical protein [Mesonia aquimarina]|uniref:hypothetical protein n=1 Tax=Mesonia aquimarina TaxID=1504967 RepID=UPI001F091E1C|nr:hypothetical protein [Mesonia aquimarina]